MLYSSKKITDRLNKLLQNKLIYPYIWLIDNTLSPTIEYFKAYSKDEVKHLIDEREEEQTLAFRLVFGLKLTPLEFTNSSWKDLNYNDHKRVLYSNKSNIKSLRPNS